MHCELKSNIFPCIPEIREKGSCECHGLWMDPIQVKFFLVILNVTTTDISSIFFTLKVKCFSDCILKWALSYTSVNLCQITPVRPVELLGIYTGVILSRVWPFVDIDMHSIYYTITLQAGVQGHPLGKEKYKSQLQVTSYAFPQACCISKSKLTGRTNQLELLGNNHSRTFQLQPYARQKKVSLPLISSFAVSLLPQLQSYLDQGCDGRNRVALFMPHWHGILLFICVSERL